MNSRDESNSKNEENDQNNDEYLETQAGADGRMMTEMPMMTEGGDDGLPLGTN